MIKTFYKNHKQIILYVVFGVLTTIVNYVSYFLCKAIGIRYEIATVIAWICAVLFAFITNKLWVFNSKSWVASVVFPELTKFFICRIATGILDVLIMWLAVDKMKWNAMLWKLVSNIIVIILNYIASKILIFKNKDTTENKNEKQSVSRN